MADDVITDVTLAVRKVDDEYTDADLLARIPRELGAGFYEIGYVLEGAFVPMLEFKAGHVDQRVAAWNDHHDPIKPITVTVRELFAARIDELESKVAALQAQAATQTAAPAETEPAPGDAAGDDTAPTTE